jgi:hypothetical protein
MNFSNNNFDLKFAKRKSGYLVGERVWTCWNTFQTDRATVLGRGHNDNDNVSVYRPAVIVPCSFKFIFILLSKGK